MSRDDSASDIPESVTRDATIDVNVVACEACRNKKCKCDRKLPVCSQCKKSRSPCNYPESFKRGFPQGYLTGLEKRLLETETALFELLYRQHAASAPSATELKQASHAMANRWHKQAKGDKMQEWVQMPLRTQAEQAAWLMQKADYASHLNEESTSSSFQPDAVRSPISATGSSRPFAFEASTPSTYRQPPRLPTEASDISTPSMSYSASSTTESNQQNPVDAKTFWSRQTHRFF